MKLVLYHAKWCGHCQQLTQKGSEPGGWTQLENKREELPFAIKVIEENNMTDEQKSNIRGFPTIELYDGGKKIANYNGNRTAEDMIKFVKSNIKKGGRRRRRKSRRKSRKKRRKSRKKRRRRRRRTRRR